MSLYAFIHLLPLFDDWALLALRLTVGAILVAHGWQKLAHLPKTIERFDASGFRPGWFWARFTMAFEIVGGIGIFAGYLTQLFAPIFVIEYMVILIGNFFRHDELAYGYEASLLTLAALLVLITLGGGNFTIGQILFGGY